jgi:hypothetical protein
VQRPAVLRNAVVLFEDNRIGLEELDILEGLARAILAAGSDDVGAHEAIAVTSRLAENVNQHQIRQELGRDMQGSTSWREGIARSPRRLVQ